MRIVSQTRNNRLEELKCHLKQRKHPEAVINYSFTKLFEPQKHTVASENLITFKRTYNPNHHFSHSKFLNCVNSFSNRELKNSFKDKKVILTTRQSSNLKKLLVRAKFQMNVIPRTPQLIGLYPCSNCIYHKNGYINPCTSFKFKLTNGKIITWNYTKYFTCDSRNVLYLLKCRTCNEFYIGETQDFKKRTRKHKSDIFHPENSMCKRCAEHIRDCTKMTEPFFEIFPFYHNEDNYFRNFKEKRFILKWKPSLNCNKTN